MIQQIAVNFSAYFIFQPKEFNFSTYYWLKCDFNVLQVSLPITAVSTIGKCHFSSKHWNFIYIYKMYTPNKKINVLAIKMLFSYAILTYEYKLSITIL